jgi:hypothetical protein
MFNSVCSILGTSYNMYWHILSKDINVMHITSEFVLSILNNNRKQN